jgi:hypothetical protein
MSAFPPIADIRRMSWHVRFVPTADISRSGKDTPLAVALSRIRHRSAKAIRSKDLSLTLIESLVLG